jgi:hypothetical protein
MTQCYILFMRGNNKYNISFWNNMEKCSKYRTRIKHEHSNCEIHVDRRYEYEWTMVVSVQPSAKLWGEFAQTSEQNCFRKLISCVDEEGCTILRPRNKIQISPVQCLILHNLKIFRIMWQWYWKNFLKKISSNISRHGRNTWKYVWGQKMTTLPNKSNNIFILETQPDYFIFKPCISMFFLGIYLEALRYTTKSPCLRWAVLLLWCEITLIQPAQQNL